MQTRISPLDGEILQSGKPAGSQRLKQRIPRASIMRPQLADMPFIFPALDEARQGELVEGAHGARVEPELLMEPFCQGRRQDHIPETIGGTKAFRERVRVDDTPLRVDALQRGDGTARQTKFAIEVVLHDPTIGALASPGEQFVAPADWIDAPGGKLVGWHDMEHAGTRLLKLRDRHTRSVHLEIIKRNVVSLVDLRKARIPRVLDGIARVAAEQLDDEPIEDLCTGTDHNLACRNIHPAKAAQIGGDGLPQAQAPRRTRGLHQGLLALVGQHGAQGARPLDVRKNPRGDMGSGHIDRETISFFGHISANRTCRGLSRRPLRIGDTTGKRATQLHAPAQVDRVEPASFPRFHIAFSHKLTIGALNRDHADAEVLSEFSLGGKAGTRHDAAADDVVFDAAVQIPVTRVIPTRVHVVGQHKISSPQN